MTLAAALGEQQEDDFCQGSRVADLARAAAAALRAASKNGQSPNRPNPEHEADGELNFPSQPARPAQMSLLERLNEP